MAVVFPGLPLVLLTRRLQSPKPYAQELTLTNLPTSLPMEVHAHESRSDFWKDTYDLAFIVFCEWFDDDLIDRGDRIADQLEEATDAALGEFCQMRERLEEEYLTPEQQRYSGRCFPKVPPEGKRPLPWPAPERVEDESVQALASIVREGPTSEPKVWAALRVLQVANVIEAVRRAEESVRERRSE